MIVVSGATGKIGTEIVGMLRKQGKEVAALTRNPTMAQAPSGVHAVPWNPSRPQMPDLPVDQIEALFICPRAMGDQHPGEVAKELLASAVDRGARRVTLLSAVTVQFGGGYRRFAKTFETIEDAVRASSLSWTILRCTDFSSNAIAWAPQIRSTTVVRGAYGDATTSTIHDRDVAAVSAETLLDDDHSGCSYVLSGPESLSQRDKVQIIGDIIGKQVAWQEISPEEVREAMISRGIPPEIPDRMLGYLADHIERAGPSSDTVERLLGRPPMSYAEWIAEHREAFQ